MSTRASSLALLAVTMLGVSFLANAQLGGADGIQIPYQGHLEVDGAPASGPFDFRLSLYNEATGAACTTHEVTTVVASGTFSVVLDDVDPQCVRGRDLYVGVEVSPDANNTAYALLGDRQKIVAATAAVSSGAGDFHVTGALNVAGNATVDGALTAESLTANAALTSGSISAGAITSQTVTANDIVLEGLNLGDSIFTQAYPVIIAGAEVPQQSFVFGPSGKALLLVSGAAYVNAAGTGSVNVLVAGQVVGTLARYFYTPQQHQNLGTGFFQISGPPGTPVAISFTRGPRTLLNLNDRFFVAAIHSL